LALVWVFEIVAAIAVQVEPSSDHSPLYVVPVLVRRSHTFVTFAGNPLLTSGCGFWIAPACSLRSSIRLNFVCPWSEIASNFT